LRGDGRPSLRSVDSEIKRCVIEPRNFLVVSLRLCQSRGPSQALAPPGPTGVSGHTGVGGTWRMIARVSRELGRPCRLHRDCRLGARLTNSRLIHGSRPEPVGTNRGRNGGNRQAKETKCGEMDGKESECPIVASKRGNGPYRTPWSEGGATLWAQRRNHAEGTEPPSVSPQGNGSCEGQRHNVTSRMPLTGTSGSVGGLGGRPPRSTRPNFIDTAKMN
jgi:hypothetical protein